MCDYVGIKIKTTATESPCSNGTVLTNNQTIENMMIKIISDTQLFLEMVLSWAMKTKNSLQNVACFSPFQFILGKNLKVLLKLSDNLPTLSVKPSSQLMQQFFFFFFSTFGNMQGSKQCWTVPRHGVTRKRSTKRSKYTWNMLRKNLQLKRVC